MIPQPGGRGALLSGGMPGNKGGSKPPDALRAKLRELGAAKSVPFLSSLLDGRITVQFVGKCPHCHRTSDLPEGDALDTLVDATADAVRASVDHRLKANEQTLKYGIGVKIDMSLNEHPEFQARMMTLRRALVDVCGEEIALQVIDRAEALSE